MKLLMRYIVIRRNTAMILKQILLFQTAYLS